MKENIEAIDKIIDLLESISSVSFDRRSSSYKSTYIKKARDIKEKLQEFDESGVTMSNSIYTMEEMKLLESDLSDSEVATLTNRSKQAIYYKRKRLKNK